MLQSLRDKITGWFATVFLGAIAIVFIFWGVNMRSDGGTSYAAKVNGDRVDTEVVRRAWQEREQRLQQMLRGSIPESMVKLQQQAVLEEHIRTQLMTQRATKLGYRAGDALLAQTIQEFPDLQVDGKFSRDRYAALLRQQGRSEPQFERELRASLTIDQLQRGIVTTSFLTPMEMLRRQALEGEQRQIDYAVIPASSFLSSAAVADSDIQAWYAAHPSDYMTPESVDLEYLEVTLADVARQVPVTDDGLHAYYEQNKEKLTTPERRRARHILITVGDGVDDAQAQKTANEVIAKLKAGGDFAKLAKEYSKDAASAAKGGDLDWASRGMFVGPFEDALFSMTKGELRGPVKTQFGYHVLRLDEVEGGQTKTFAEARPELEAEYRRDQAQSLFYERSQKLADESFRALTELGSVSKSLSLPIQRATGFTRQGGAPFGTDPKVIEAAFRPEALDKGENSSLIAIGDDRAVVIRVSAHQAATPMPLAAVRTQIEAKLKDSAAQAAAAKRGEDILARLKSGTTWANAMADAKLATIGVRNIDRTDSKVPAAVRQIAFEIPRVAVTEAKPAFRGIVVEKGDYALVTVTEVKAGKTDAGAADYAAKMRQAAQAEGSSEFGAYLSEAERTAKIERNPKVFE